MHRHFFRSNNLQLSYLDAGGEGEIVIALHAHWMQASGYESLAKSLLPNWRIIALDQRGHGHSDHTMSYSRDDYIEDIMALFQHLGITQPVVVMGNSLGGVNAYQFAARHPAMVRALIIEDIGVEIHGDVSFSLNWKGPFGTRDEIEERIGSRFLPYFKDSIHHTVEGWKLMFDVDEMLISHDNIYGKYWNDWLKSDCPCLLVRGASSRVTNEDEMKQMASRRANTTLVTMDGGHVLHMETPKEFNEIVQNFLSKL